MELEENCAVHMCGTRKTSFRVPARLLHGGLSVPVCMGPRYTEAEVFGLLVLPIGLLPLRLSHSWIYAK